MSSATLAGNIYGRSGNIYGAPSPTAAGNIYGAPVAGVIVNLLIATLP
jgi:hypothetical protein